MNGVIGYTEAGGLASHWPNDAESSGTTTTSGEKDYVVIGLIGECSAVGLLAVGT